MINYISLKKKKKTSVTQALGTHPKAKLRAAGSDLVGKGWWDGGVQVPEMLFIHRFTSQSCLAAPITWVEPLFSCIPYCLCIAYKCLLLAFKILCNMLYKTFLDSLSAVTFTTKVKSNLCPQMCRLSSCKPRAPSLTYSP